MNGSIEGMWRVKRHDGLPAVPIPFAAASASARAFACAGSPASRPSSSTMSCHALVASSTCSE